MSQRRVRPDRAASKVSRRRFLRLTAAGAAVAIVAPAATLARAAAPARSAARPKPAAPAPAPGRHVASAKEIEKLKGYLESSLKAVRAFELPPGSDLAFSFRALKPRRTRRGG